MFRRWYKLLFQCNDITTLFFTVNIELDWSSFWFIENRLLLNVKKLSALYSIDNIQLKLPDPEMAVNSTWIIAELKIADTLLQNFAANIIIRNWSAVLIKNNLSYKAWFANWLTLSVNLKKEMHNNWVPDIQEYPP